MSNAEFKSADTSKIAKFQEESKKACAEFKAIKKEFQRINKESLSGWKGVGADAYKYETDHILEKIGSVDDVLEMINNSAVKDIRDNYSKLDDDLAEFNKNPYRNESEQYKCQVLQMYLIQILQMKIKKYR